MRLTATQQLPGRDTMRVQPVRTLAVALLAAGMALVFVIDRLTDLPGVQHLYYFPIIFAATRFGMGGGAVAAALAIALYHLANPHMLTWRYGESDILQMAVFVATGLRNLRSFEVELRRMLESARLARTPVSLLVVDLDRLKSLNDQHGHLVGAEAVRTVGHIIAERIPSEAIACRYGGDEFVIALPHCPASAAHSVADDLRRAVHATAPVLGGVHFPERTLSISVGLACRSFDSTVEVGGDDGEALFRSADAALYMAKNGGRNRISAR
jgi:diguanylate cyclase (GGDEF)-like protein